MARKPITYKGVHYESRQALADAYSLTTKNMSYRLSNGISLDTPKMNRGEHCKAHPWRKFSPELLSKGRVSEDQRKAMEKNECQ